MIHHMALDAESRAALQQIAGEEAGIPERLHDRIAGEDVGSMRRDAGELATQLGIAPQQPERTRDEGGRFAEQPARGFTELIREAAGRS
jgi:hypothetical protein